MNVTRGQIFQRGMTHRCPNCGQPTLFKPKKLFELNPSCSNCGCRFDADEGAFLGAFALNYGVSAFGFILPFIVVAYYFDVSLSWIAIWAVLASLVVPLLLYRASRSWWLMCDMLFDPTQLPGNRDSAG